MSDDLPEELRAIKGGDIERIQEEYRAKQSQSVKDSQNFSQASSSKITHPDEDERINQQKQERFHQAIEQEVTKAIEPINLQIQQIPNIIQATIQQMVGQQQGVPVTQNQSPSMPVGLPSQDGSNPQPGLANLAQMDPSFLTGIAQMIQAIRGTPSAPASDPYAEMFKQIGVNIMQAGVDGIYKNVYEGYKPTPPQKALPNNAANNTNSGFV